MWERPEDLRFLTPGGAAIAFLARTVWIDRENVTSRPRLQPLHFTEATPRMAVVRIESRGDGLPAHSAVVRELLPAAQSPGIRALQIDYDARQSELNWYAGLLAETRRDLPRNVILTITALASWCESPRWIDSLPVADAVPMLFRMGPHEYPPVDDFRARKCRSSAGVATDELPSRLPRGRRLYFFHPRAWTPQAYQAVLVEARRWQ